MSCRIVYPLTLGTTRQEKNRFFLYYIKKNFNCQISSYISLPLGSAQARKRCVFLSMNSRTALLESVVQNFFVSWKLAGKKKNEFFYNCIILFFICQVLSKKILPPRLLYTSLWECNFQPEVVAYGARKFEWHFQRAGAAQGYSKRRASLQLSTKWGRIWG